MSVSIRFLGAAQNVTGSRYLINASGKNILIDCGIYQERDFRSRNWESFLVPPSTIDCMLLTHAHLDHCGLIPKLVREGFSGEIFCTPATAEIAKIVLLDSAHIQEEDAAFKRRRHAKEKRKPRREVLPLYTARDAEKCLSRFHPVPYEERVTVAPGVDAVFHDAGHILGSSMIKLHIGTGSGAKTVLFSGDIGRWDKPILRDPTVFEEADAVVMESTYGDRIHSDDGDIDTLLCDAVNAAHESGGNILMPSFAIGRTQEILYRLNDLLQSDRISYLMAFVDSLMAVRVTDVFRRHAEVFDQETLDLLSEDQSPFAMPNLKLVTSVADSKAINHIKGTAIIIASSGMCTGGRIKHHLMHNIGRSQSLILFVGYQAVGTLGREILDGKEEVRILGGYYQVRAQIRQIHGFSAHADQGELLAWIEGIKNGPRKIFVTHGEPNAAQALAGLLRQHTGADVAVPEYRQSLEAF